MKKLFVVGVIVLFISLALSPSIYANESMEQQADNSIYSQDDKLISLPVREYKPDGTIREYFVELTQSQYDEMTGRLQIAEDLDERLSIYKDYRVVPEDVTSESLRAGMEEKARRFGLDKKMDKMVGSRGKLPSSVGSINMHFNMFCLIENFFMISIFPTLGLSLLTSHLNFILFLLWDIRTLIPSIDIITLCIGVGGTVQAINGTMPDFELGIGGYMPSFHGCVLLVGFVGYAVGGILGPYRPCGFEGFASFICTLGTE